jgi:hypothetical protein
MPETPYQNPIFERKISVIYWLTIIGLVMLGAFAYAAKSVFFADALISIIVVSAVFAIRKQVLFSWEGTALCCIGWLMNMAGTLGAYELSYQGLGWDKLLHFTSILGVTLLAYAYFKQRDMNLSLFEVGIIVFLIAQGVGAVNEISEFIGSQYFGVGQGLFGMMNGLSEPASKFDRFDTHWDLIVNTIAIVVGLAITTLRNRSPVSAKAKLKERTAA